MNDSDSSSIPPHAPAGEPRRRRRYPWVVLALALILAGVVAAAPGLLSTTWVRSTALAWYNDTIPGEVAIEDLSLSWLGGQSLEQLVVRDAQGDQVLKLDSVTTDLSLLDALRRRLSLGRTEIRGLDADLQFGADGTTNLARALGGEPGAPGDETPAPVVPVTGNMAFTDGRVVISAPGIEPVLLEDLRGALAMTGLDAPIELSFNGVSRQGELQGTIALDGTVSDLFTDGELTPAAARMDIDAGIEELPVDALDQLLNAGGLLSAALGDRTSLAVKASGDAQHQNLSIDARAPNGELEIEGVVADNRFQLLEPARARLQVTPGLVDALNARASGEPAFRLSGPAVLQMRIEELGVPLDPLSVSRVSITGELTAPEPLRLTDVKEIGDAELNDLRLRIDSPALGDQVGILLTGTPATRGVSGELKLEGNVQRLFDDAGNLQLDGMIVVGESSIAGVPTSLVDSVLRQNGQLVEAVGPEIDMELDAGTSREGDVRIAVKMNAERVQTDEMVFSVGEYLTLSEPARLHMTVTPALWRTLAGDEAAYRLAEPLRLTLDIVNMRFAMPGGETPLFSPEHTQLQATMTADALVLSETGSGHPTRVDGLTLDLAGGTLDEFDLDASGEVHQAAGTLEMLEASPLRVKLAARSGFKTDASLKKVTGSLNLDSSGIRTTLSLAIDEGFTRLALTEPATVNAVVTPALLSASQDGEGPAVSLQQAAAVEAAIEALAVPLAPFSFAGVSAEGTARIDSLALRSAGNVSTRIDDSRVTFGFEGKDKGRARLDVNARVRPEAGEPGELSLAMTAGNLLDDGGRLSGDALSLELDGRLQHLPVALVDQLLDMDGLTTATLGDTADFELSARLENMNGPLSISLSSPNTQADIKTRFTDAGLTLTEPLTARIEPTPEFGSKVLAKVHPVFETLQRAEQPIRFEMPAEDVLIPIEDYDFSRVRIPEMTMDFGKLVLKSGWLLRGVIGLGRQFGRLENVEREEWPAWFTPAVLEVRDGKVLYSRRLDLLLAERLHLATWGSADVSRDVSNLTLAFMPDTMERVFSITVSGDDALHVPITGPLSDPDIDYKKAGTDLARLRAQEEVSGENALAGALLGAVTGKATGGGAIPPASVSPLPWAGELEALDQAEKQREPEAAAPQTSQTQQQNEPAKQEKRPSTEEQVIKGLIDIFGGKKKE